MWEKTFTEGNDGKSRGANIKIMLCLCMQTRAALAQGEHTSCLKEIPFWEQGPTGGSSQWLCQASKALKSCNGPDQPHLGLPYIHGSRALSKLSPGLQPLHLLVLTSLLNTFRILLPYFLLLTYPAFHLFDLMASVGKS